MIKSNTLDFFAGIPVADYPAALKWYEKLLGYPPSFSPDDTESVWELAEHRYLYVVHEPDNAGHARLTLFLDNFDAVVAEIDARGLEPLKRETYENGVRKTTYRDPEGNEIGFGGAAVEGDGQG